jgi:hypothetical protein
VRQVHTIAFGSGADPKKLKEIADAGKGTFHLALTGADLLQAFVDIAKDSTLQGQLVEALGKNIAGMIQERLVAEFL